MIAFINISNVIKKHMDQRITPSIEITLNNSNFVNVEAYQTDEPVTIVYQYASGIESALLFLKNKYLNTCLIGIFSLDHAQDVESLMDKKLIDHMVICREGWAQRLNQLILQVCSQEEMHWHSISNNDKAMLTSFYI